MDNANRHQPITAAEQRDDSGRAPGAPAWRGDLTTLSPANLDARDKGLSALIANLTVGHRAGTDRPRWHARTPEERMADEFETWVERLVEARNEQARREDQLGGFSAYAQLINTPAWGQPWTGQPATAV